MAVPKALCGVHYCVPLMVLGPTVVVDVHVSVWVWSRCARQHLTLLKSLRALLVDAGGYLTILSSGWRATGCLLASLQLVADAVLLVYSVLLLLIEFLFDTAVVVRLV